MKGLKGHVEIEMDLKGWWPMAISGTGNYWNVLNKDGKLKAHSGGLRRHSSPENYPIIKSEIQKDHWRA